MARSRILFIIPLLATIGAILFYCYTYKVELDQIKYEQNAKVKSLANELDKFVIVSNSLSKFIEKDINDKKLNRQDIEKKLYQYLNSAPQEIIYGIGLWFEPFQLNKNEKYNGIYIHQDLHKSGKFKLTYEWNSPEYNYPAQGWYLKGKHSNDSVFTEPYFDAGLVYTTNSRAFYFNQKRRGVISVDLVVPLLQNLIKQHSVNSNDYTYILDGNNKVLAHFEKNKIESHPGFKLKNAKSLLDIEKQEVDKWLKINPSFFIFSENHHDKLGWIIKAQTSKVVGFYRTSDLFYFLILGILVIWLFYFYFLRLFQNIDKQAELAQEEREKNKIQLLQASKMASLGEIASGVAHEINSPLMVILGKSKQLQRTLSSNQFNPVEAKDQLELINKTVYRIANIISGLKTFSRSTDNDAMTSESLKKIIDDTLAIANEKLKHSGINLNLDFPDDDVLIRCRSGQISQVLLNLLSNAHDAVCVSKNLEKWIKIKYEFNHERTEVSLFVIDSGDGIKKSDIDKIMNPFFTTKEVGKGTGLGLSISKGIIEEHGGSIYFNSSMKDTTFIIKLMIEKSL